MVKKEQERVFNFQSVKLLFLQFFKFIKNNQKANISSIISLKKIKNFEVVAFVFFILIIFGYFENFSFCEEIKKFENNFKIEKFVFLREIFKNKGELKNAYVRSLDISEDNNIYIAGEVDLQVLPQNDRANNSSNQGNKKFNFSNGFICKLNNNLDIVKRFICLDGESFTNIKALLISKNNYIYIAGFTESKKFFNFDVLKTNGFCKVYNGGKSDGFVCKLDKDLNIIAFTFIGGEGADFINSLIIDDFENVYLTGNTSSKNFLNNSQINNNQDFSIFACKLNGNLDKVLSNKILAKGKFNNAYSIGLDDKLNVFICGEFDDFNSRFSDILVYKLNNNLDKILAEKFFGGKNSDCAYSLDLDKANNVYLTGYTSSDDFLITQNAYCSKYNKHEDVFICKLSGDLQNILASTYLGGKKGENANFIRIKNNSQNNDSEDVYITGETSSNDFPNALFTSDYTYGAFFCKFNSDLTKLLGACVVKEKNFENSYFSQAFVFNKFNNFDKNENIYLVGYGDENYDLKKNNGFIDSFIDGFVIKLTN